MLKNDRSNGKNNWVFGFCVGDIFAHPLRGLNENFDPSKATSARPRKLGLQPQTVRGALQDASLVLDGCPKFS